MLFVDNRDQPGSIGAVGTIAGRHNINISFMEVGRLNLRGQAMMVLGLDDPMPNHVLEEIKPAAHLRCEAGAVVGLIHEWARIYTNG